MKVFFDGDFRHHHGYDHAGKEIYIGKEFQWGDHVLNIPAVYSCGKGLVIDFCIRVEQSKIQAFMKKWHLDAEHDDDGLFTKEQRRMIYEENPLIFDFRARPFLNGKELKSARGFAVTFNPCFAGDTFCETEAKEVLEYYGLDLSFGWIIWRKTYEWATKRRPKIRALSLSLEKEKSNIFGPRFRVEASGDAFSFDCPLTGREHTLTVQEYEQQFMDFSKMPDQDMEYPPYYTAMTYTVNPDLPADAITISDSTDSDRPCRKKESLSEFEARVAASVSIIGGAF